MTNRLAFELGQFAYRLKDRGADSLYDDFMKIMKELIRDEPADSIEVPVIGQPSPINTESIKVPWETESGSLVAEKSDADITPHLKDDSKDGYFTVESKPLWG